MHHRKRASARNRHPARGAKCCTSVLLHVVVGAVFNLLEQFMPASSYNRMSNLVCGCEKMRRIIAGAKSVDAAQAFATPSRY